MFKPPLASVKLRLPSLEELLPPASVVILLEALFNVKLPVPFKLKLVAVNAAVCVTAPEAVKLIVLFVAVKVELIARAPPNNEIGPKTVVVEPMVMFEVFVALPIVSPEIPELNVTLVFGQVNALEKLVPEGCKVKVPVVSILVAKPPEGVSKVNTLPVNTMLAVLLVI